MKNFTRLLTIGILLIGLSYTPGCSYSDTAIVTIRLEQVNSAGHLMRQRSILDRLCSLFVSDAYAYSPGPSVAWASGRDSLNIIVTGEGIGTINFSMPPVQSEFTFEVPSGKQRKITVVTANTTDPNYTGINWGGHTVVDLNPGDETNLTITMLPMTKINVIDKPYPSTLAPNWNQVSGVAVVLGYRLYRSTSPDGPFSLVGSPSAYYYEDGSVTTGVTYYYKVSVYTASSEGELSEYSSAVPD